VIFYAVMYGLVENVQVGEDGTKEKSPVDATNERGRQTGKRKHEA